MKNPLKNAIVEITFIFDNKAKTNNSSGLFDTKIRIRNIIKGTIVGIILLFLIAVLLVVLAILFPGTQTTV